MALQKNINIKGITVSNSYMRINSVEADKQNEDSDWSLKVLVNVYKNASTRNAKTPKITNSEGNLVQAEGAVGSAATHLQSNINTKEYKFSYDPESEQGDLIALAYAKLKTHEDFSGASDV